MAGRGRVSCGSPSRGGSPRLHVGTSLAGTAAIEMSPLPAPAPAPSLSTLRKELALRAGVDPEKWRDWAGLPEDLLAKVAETLVAQTEAGEAARLKQRGVREELIQERMADRKRKGNCPLFVFARVCKPWRKVQLKVGGPLRTREGSDVVGPGSVELVKWALAEGFPRQISTMWTMAHEAAQYGHLELVKWLFGEGVFPMDEEMMDDRMTSSAVSSGNLELVRWLRDKRFELSTWTCKFAASAGQLGVLQWLRANGCPWDAETCEEAAQYGQLATLRWARENGCSWDKRACECAVRGGHLEILQWLRANGCPWDWETCDWAVIEGHVEVLRWARENGCPWRAQTRDWAAEKLGYTDDLGNLVD